MNLFSKVEHLGYLNNNLCLEYIGFITITYNKKKSLLLQFLVCLGPMFLTYMYFIFRYCSKSRRFVQKYYSNMYRCVLPWHVRQGILHNTLPNNFLKMKNFVLSFICNEWPPVYNLSLSLSFPFIYIGCKTNNHLVLFHKLLYFQHVI